MIVRNTLTLQNHTILPGTITFYSGMARALSWVEAKAVLDILGQYSYDTIRRVEHDIWTDIMFRKLPIAKNTPIARITLPIQFSGGPPGQRPRYYNGRVTTFVLDRILNSCYRIGKTQAHRRILQTLTKIRRMA